MTFRCSCCRQELYYKFDFDEGAYLIDPCDCGSASDQINLHDILSLWRQYRRERDPGRRAAFGALAILLDSLAAKQTERR